MTSSDTLAQQMFRRQYGHFINGQWVGGDSGELIAVRNPASGQVISHIQAGNGVDIDRAVAAAAAAFPTWSKSSPYQRQEVLLGMSAALKKRFNDFAMMETLNNGKPLRESLNFDLPATIGQFEFFAGAAFHLHGQVMDFDGASCLIHREPLGVCAQIIPWNIPLMMTALKLAPALASGNTVVLKPAESVCLSVLEFIQDVAELLPPGVVNVVTGYGPAVGEALVTDPRVSKVTFTGSRPTARKIINYASVNIIPQTMELGGKSANIVCADADIDAAAEGAAISTIFNKGEVCISGSRVFVHRDIEEAFTERLSHYLGQVVQGDPTEMATTLGAQASQLQMDKICRYLQIGRDEGARLIAGGEPARVAGHEGGYFIQPTVFAGVDNTMVIAQEEIFGPVTCLIPWESEEEVLAMANASEYGLGGGLWTRDLNRAHRMAAAMQTGTVWVNRYYNFMPGQPLGGYKQSGYGREGALETLNAYTHTKAVVLNLQEGPLGYFGQ